MIDFNKLDKIEISDGEALTIKQWVGNNTDKLRIANPILNEGLIMFADDATTIYFKVVSQEKVHFNYYAIVPQISDKLIEVISFDIVNPFDRLMSILNGSQYKNNNGWIYKDNIKVNHALNKQDNPVYEEFVDGVIALCKNTFLNVMTYAQFYREEVSVKIGRYVKSSSKKKSSNNKPHKVKLTKTYKLNVANVHLDKRVFTRHTEYWTVRGHWRTTKTGKRIWVKPFAKGNKGKKSGKTYTI